MYLFEKTSMNMVLLTNILMSLTFSLYTVISRMKKKDFLNYLCPNLLMLASFCGFLFFQNFPIILSLILPNFLLLSSLEAFSLLIRKKDYSIASILLFFLMNILFVLWIYYAIALKQQALELHSLIAFGFVLFGIFRLGASKIRHLNASSRIKGIYDAINILIILIHLPLAAANWSPLSLKSAILLRFFSLLFLMLIWNLTFYDLMVDHFLRKNETNKHLFRSMFERLDLLNGFLNHQVPDQDFTVIYPPFFKIISELTGLHFLAFSLIDSERDSLVMQAQTGLDQQQVDLLKYVPLNIPGVAPEAVKKGEFQIIEVNRYPKNELRSSILSLGIEKLGAFPVVSNGKIIGVLTFGQREEDLINEDYITILQVITTQMGIALYNRNLYRDSLTSDAMKGLLMEQYPQGIMIHIANKEIIECNDLLAQWIGMDKESLRHRAVSDLPEWFHELLYEIESREDHSQELEMTWSVSAKEILEIRVQSQPLEWKGNRALMSFIQKT